MRDIPNDRCNSEPGFPREHAVWVSRAEGKGTRLQNPSSPTCRVLIVESLNCRYPAEAATYVAISASGLDTVLKTVSYLPHKEVPVRVQRANDEEWPLVVDVIDNFARSELSSRRDDRTLVR